MHIVVVGFGSLSPLHIDRAGTSAARKERRPGEADRQHSRDRLKLTFHLLCETPALLLVIPVYAGIDWDEKQVLGVESYLYTTQIIQRAQKEPDSDQQNQRGGYLYHQKRLAE